MSLDEFMHDRGMRFAMRYSILLIVEATADLGLAILKQYFREEARSHREVFLKLAERAETLNYSFLCQTVTFYAT